MNSAEKYNLDPLHFQGFDDNENRVYTCPFCGDDIKVKKDLFYGRCPACKATIVDYKPQAHQVEFHRSNAMYRLLLGGYGTGKTTMCVAEVAQHSMTVPNGRTLITAPKLQQVTDAILPELNKFIPPWLVKERKKSPTPLIKLRNGHEIVVYASNDEERLRSLNLTMFYMEEASAISLEVFTQLQARLRNMAGITKDRYGRVIADYRTGIVSSNPEQGWLVDNFLLYASKIFASESVDVSAYKKLQKFPEPAYHAFLSSSRDNIYLPPGFLSNISAGKSRAWIRKYIDCALEIKEGAVYPDFTQHVVDDFPIPNDWKRVAGFDKGFADETAMVWGAIEPRTGTVFLYQEYYVSQQPLSYHAKKIAEFQQGLHMYNQIQADPSVLHRNDRDGKSYQDTFYNRCGIHLEPANNSIGVGIETVRDYMYTGKLKIFQSLVNLKDEAYKYVYPDEIKSDEEKPKDGQDHLMDSMRYLVMGLPQDPYEMTEIATRWMDKRHVDYVWATDVDKEEENSVFYLGGNV